MPEQDPKCKAIPPDAQPHDRLYKMQIRFKADAGIKSLDEILEACFPGEQTSLKDGVILRITQTAPFIPDDAMLAEYAKAIEASYAKSKSKARVSNVRFDGYDYIYMVKPEPESPPCVHKKNGVCATGASSTGACVLPCSHYEAVKEN